MPKFTFIGSIFMTQEYAFDYELEANNLDEAREKFEEGAAGKPFYLEVELEPVGKPFDVSGIYRVYDKPLDEVDEDFPEDDAVYDGGGFKGPR